MTIPQNTCTSYSFPNFASENSTLGSSKVLPLVNGAYDFDLIYGTYNASSPSYQSYILSVTGTQHVSGDWQSGYNISYTGNKFLNVTVQYTKPDTYVVSHLAVYNVLDRNSTKSFTPEQQQIIGAAMANSTVQGLMTGPPYYVTAVYPYLGGPLNGTTAVQLLQVNGIRELNINVNTTNMQVVFANAVNNVDGECFYPSGYCLTDPWGVNVDAGLVLPPFYVSVSYPGQWSLKILGSDNATGVSAPFLYNQTFTGEGNMTITVPWFSDTGGTTLFASAQKTDGGTATLSVTVNWLSGWPGDIGDPTTATAGPTASTATVYDYQVEAS